MTTATTQPGVTAKASMMVVALCWVAVLLDGFDLVVLGASIPSILDDTDFGADTATITAISTAGLVGMTIGALTIGTLTDILGRRRSLMVSVLAFSILTLLCAFAPNPAVFGLLRFLAGVGLGGALPTALALVNEFTPKRKAGSASTTVMTGYHVGAVATAVLALILLEPYGWRSMFVAGAIPALVLLPLMYRYLPESPAYLLVKGRRDEAQAIADAHGLELEPAAETPTEKVNPIKALFAKDVLRTSIAIWVTSFMGLLLVYGLNTWLPTIMRAAGYELGAALTLLLVLNTGAIAGLLVAGRVANQIGPRTAAIIWFTCAAVFLALLSVKIPYGVYVLVFLAGCFVFSAQVLVYALTSAVYPPEARATALGWSAGIGRLGAICGPVLGGALLDADLASPWGFYAFAAVGLIGAVAISTSRA